MNLNSGDPNLGGLINFAVIDTTTSPYFLYFFIILSLVNQFCLNIFDPALWSSLIIHEALHSIIWLRFLLKQKLFLPLLCCFVLVLVLDDVFLGCFLSVFSVGFWTEKSQNFFQRMSISWPGVTFVQAPGLSCGDDCQMTPGSCVQLEYLFDDTDTNMEVTASNL